MMRIISLLSIIAVLLLSSCLSSSRKLAKEMIYFNEGLDTAKLNKYILIEPVIQKGDLLQISISSRSSSANQMFSNSYSPGASTSSGNSLAAGGPAQNSYMVDIASGEIKLPLLGIIQADGITKTNLEKEIITRASEYLKEDPIVNIRYMNLTVTFLGSVAEQGTRTFQSERISFLQALGEVGGISPGGNIKEILLFREQNGTRTAHTIDLTNGNFFNSPNYYLKQNDVIYVKPTKRQIQNSDQSFQRTFQFVNLGFFALNLIVTLFTLSR